MSTRTLLALCFNNCNTHVLRDTTLGCLSGKARKARAPIWRRCRSRGCTSTSSLSCLRCESPYATLQGHGEKPKMSRARHQCAQQAKETRAANWTSEGCECGKVQGGYCRSLSIRPIVSASHYSGPVLLPHTEGCFVYSG
jgi:hypothetical protein